MRHGARDNHCIHRARRMEFADLNAAPKTENLRREAIIFHSMMRQAGLITRRHRRLWEFSSWPKPPQPKAPGTTQYPAPVFLLSSKNIQSEDSDDNIEGVLRVDEDLGKSPNFIVPIRYSPIMYEMILKRLGEGHNKQTESSKHAKTLYIMNQMDRLLDNCRRTAEELNRPMTSLVNAEFVFLVGRLIGLHAEYINHSCTILI